MRGAALGAALAAALTLTAAPAVAASSPLPDPSRTATLHITEERGPADGSAPEGDGTMADPGDAPAPGAGFTLNQVDPVNLTTQTGWEDEAALAAHFDASSDATAKASVSAAGFTLGPARSGTTDASGTLTFSGLPLGLYLVEQTTVPVGTTAATPFLATLPMTDPDTGDGWMYDVFVYPKSGVTAITKTVSDAGAHVAGDVVTWTIAAGIPASAASGPPLREYEITDQIDARLTATGTAVALRDPVSGAATHVPSADYTTTAPSTSDGRMLRVRFATPGLKLLAAHAGEQVLVSVSTVASGASTATADILNHATLDVAGAAATPPIVSNQAETRWGAVRFTKTAAGTGTPLAGARFTIYASQADARAGRNPLAISGRTGADGSVVVDGLRVSDFANGHGVTAADPGYNTYYAVETTAPSGYGRQTQPIAFAVLSSDPDYTASVDVTDAAAAAVAPGNPLAHTGTSISITLVACMVAMVLCGIGVLVYRRRAA
jgi:fimbrial isopeptide formation D2 family protein